MLSCSDEMTASFKGWPDSTTTRKITIKKMFNFCTQFILNVFFFCKSPVREIRFKWNRNNKLSIEECSVQFSLVQFSSVRFVSVSKVTFVAACVAGHRHANANRETTDWCCIQKSNRQKRKKALNKTFKLFKVSFLQYTRASIDCF